MEIKIQIPDGKHCDGCPLLNIGWALECGYLHCELKVGETIFNTMKDGNCPAYQRGKVKC